MLTAVPCAGQSVLVYLFYTQQCLFANPKLLIYPSTLPSPLVTTYFLCLNLFLFCKFDLYYYFRFHIGVISHDISF